MHYFLYIMDDPSFSADPGNLRDCHQCSKFLFNIFGIKHFFEMIKKIVIKIFLVLGHVLMQFFSSFLLHLSIFLLEVINYSNELYVFKLNLNWKST